jgi:hypothetical protein
MEDLITNTVILFDDRAPAATATTSPPLPPAPVGQPTPNYAYGSAHTKVASVPALGPPPIRQGQPEDFTPRLPPRPANSIHPSSRANPTSPTKANMDPPPLPTRPGQASPPKHAVSEKPAPPVPKVTMPLPADNDLPPPASSVNSTLVATQEDDERVSMPEEHRDNMSFREQTLMSPDWESPRTPKSIASSLPSELPSEPAHPDGDGPPAPPSVPTSFPS